MTKRHPCGHTSSGQPITNEEVEKLAEEAEAGSDVGQLHARRNKRGRPTIGNAPSSVESVRLDPELRRQLLQRAEANMEPPRLSSSRSAPPISRSSRSSKLAQPQTEQQPRPCRKALPAEAQAVSGCRASAYWENAGSIFPMKAKVDSVGRILVPKPLREAVGITPGSTVDVSRYGSGVQISPAGRVARLVEEDGVLVATGDATISDEDVFGMIDSGRR